MTNTMFDKSAQTIAIMEFLKTVSIGEVIGYDKISDLISQPIQQNRHYLYSAMRSLQSDGLSFGTVRGMGVKRLSAEEVPTIGDNAIIRIRRSSRNARKKMQVISRMNDVDNSTRVRVNATVSILGVIEHFSNGKSVKDAEKVSSADANNPIPPMKLLDALRR